jgi:hypothetical protein
LRQSRLRRSRHQSSRCKTTQEHSANRKDYFFNNIDPKRHFFVTNYCIAKGSLDHLVGASEQFWWNRNPVQAGRPARDRRLREADTSPPSRRR